MSKNIYIRFKTHLSLITDYYTLLVNQTKSKQQVGSTNEWVLDNYYMLSEQEKVLRVELRSKLFKQIGSRRMRQIEKGLTTFLEKTYYHVDKHVLFDHIVEQQQMNKDYMTYNEVCVLLPLLKVLIVDKLSDLCDHLRATGSYMTDPAEVSLDADNLDQAAKDNLLMMNLFNSMRSVVKLQMSEVYDRVSFSERKLCGEQAGMYDQMADQTKSDYRDQIVRQARKAHCDEYEYVCKLVERADERGEHVGWQLFKPKAWERRAHLYVWIVALSSLLLSLLFALLAMDVFSSQFSGPTSWGWWVAFAVCCLLMLVPMSQIVIDLFNYLNAVSSIM